MIIQKFKCKHEKEITPILRGLINRIYAEFAKQKPRIKSFDSNIIHFMIHKIVKEDKKLSKKIPYGWFIHGPYCYLIDDILIKYYGMDKKYHQLSGKDPFRTEFGSTILFKDYVKMQTLVRCRINMALRYTKCIKKVTNTEALGCSIDEYMRYLERRFHSKMSWKNHNKLWELDHIRPINMFNLKFKSHQLKAFNYKNTRPLLKEHNRARPRNGRDL